ncbi:MAG: hypothetical protein JO325_07220 [Solirubrobacterales bacterium]|nr:hypothetical protein [Solirubrobacterales bacterium]
MTSRTATTAAIILSLAAAGAPAAAARPDFAPTARQAPPSVYSRPDKSMLPTSATAGGDFLAPAAPPVVARVQAPQSGFDWGDAGIGAGGLALSVIGIGGAFAVSQRRSRRTTALPS